MAEKIVAHLHKETPDKDRLVLIALVAILTFTVMNTIVLVANLNLGEASLAML